MSHPIMVTVDDVRDFLGENARGVLVDVLPSEQYDRHHIPGSAQACVFETAFLDHMSKVAPDRAAPVLVYGAGNSLDAAVAAAKLLGAGYRDVRVFAGGVDAWRAAGQALEGSAPEKVDPAFPPLTPQFPRYSLLPGESVIRWVGRNDNHSHWGTVGLSSGELRFESGRGAGFVTVDMNSLANDDLAGSSWQDALLRHLASEDFFHVTRFPEARLRLTELTPLEDASAGMPNYHLKGLAGIRGHEQPVEADISLRNVLDEKEGNRLILAGQLNLDRTLWGVLYGSARYFRYLGMHKVDDLISLDAHVVFRPA